MITDTDRQKLLSQIHLHEGERPKPYTDTVGKITIGVGRNLTDVGLAQDEIDLLLVNDLKRSENDLNKNLSWWTTLDVIRQRVILDMCFNMGIGGLLTFKTTLVLIQQGKFDQASANMLASKWAKQVGARAERLSTMMKTGKDYT